MRKALRLVLLLSSGSGGACDLLPRGEARAQSSRVLEAVFRCEMGQLPETQEALEAACLAVVQGQGRDRRASVGSLKGEEGPVPRLYGAVRDTGEWSCVGPISHYKPL